MRATRNPSMPRLSRVSAMLIPALLLVAGQAAAEWKVSDRNTHEGLDRVNETLESQTNKRLEEIRNQQKIGKAGKSATEDPKDPELSLDEEKPTEVAQFGEETRCPDSGTKSKTGQNQLTICKEIVKTELAQYKYALAMRKVALERQKRLKAIEDARANLTDDSTGKLQSNSNELLALLARMEVDRQQYRTYMDAYAARLSYLRALRESLGENALNGKKAGTTPGDVVTGVGTLATLRGALEASQSSYTSAGARFKKAD